MTYFLAACAYGLFVEQRIFGWQNDGGTGTEDDAAATYLAALPRARKTLALPLPRTFHAYHSALWLDAACCLPVFAALCRFIVCNNSMHLASLRIFALCSLHDGALWFNIFALVPSLAPYACAFAYGHMGFSIPSFIYGRSPPL